MTFTFNTGVPAAGNNPSVDQPDMLSNNVSTNSILAVDHISFNTAGGGQHLQMHMNATPNYVAVPPPPVGNDSIIYSNAGIASAAAQLFLRNSNVILPLSNIRAWAFCNSAGIIATQSQNVTSVVRNSLGNYTVTLVTNAVSSTNFAIFLTSTLSPPQPVIDNYSITGIGTFTLTFVDINKNFVDPTTFSIMVLQI